MDNKIVANIKSLGIDIIKHAGSGHSGIVLSSAPIIYTVYAKHMHINPKDYNWINRDRFVMSAGHGSALLYSTLYMAGFLSLGDLKNFREIDSRTPGHPEYKKTPGVDISTGLLGQGIASAVGFAIAEKKLKNDFKNIDYYTYVLCSDGDLMEGISYEAASLAGTLKLDNLIVLYDSNKISLDGFTKNTFTENVRERFEALGWYTILTTSKINDIDKAIRKAKKINLPVFIEVSSILGEGSILENTNEVHSKVLDDKDIENLKKKLNIKNEPFYVGENLKKTFRDEIAFRTSKKYNAFNDKLYNDYEFDINKFQFYKKEALRDTNHRILNLLSDRTPLLFGGSADLSSSTKTYLDNKKDFSSSNYGGVNVWFGVREHLMGAILNGLALSGFMPFGSTFLVFSDYLRPALRMSSLMDLPVTYIFSHDGFDGILDGPTHVPTEHIASLRTIPNLTIFRPCDGKELLGVWKCIFERKKPSVLILSKKEVHTLENTNANYVKNGAYVVLREKENIDFILLASGSDVETAILVCFYFAKQGKSIRVVSMPSAELFKKMPLKYQNEILPAGKKVIVIESGTGFGLRDFVSNNKYLITLNDFCPCGKTNDVLNKMDFSVDKIIEKVQRLI